MQLIRKILLSGLVDHTYEKHLLSWMYPFSHSCSTALVETSAAAASALPGGTHVKNRPSLHSCATDFYFFSYLHFYFFFKEPWVTCRKEGHFLVGGKMVRMEGNWKWKIRQSGNVLVQNWSIIEKSWISHFNINGYYKADIIVNLNRWVYLTVQKSHL